MGDAQYKPDHRGVAQMMRSAEMHILVTDAAFDAIPFAQAIAPDAPPYGEGYIADFHVDGGKTEKIAGTRRAVAELYNDSDHSLVIEKGVGYNMGHHVLARTADHIENG